MADCIRIPVIKVKDIHSGIEHIVGTNSHDQLVIEDNAIHYNNTQCMSGTRFNDKSYDFIGTEPDEYEPETMIELLTVEQFVALYENIAKEQNDHEENRQKTLRENFSKIFAEEERSDEIKNRPDHIYHT